MQLKTSVLAVALTVLPLGAVAAGLGKITVLSSLGQPLRAEIDIGASREELPSLSARIAPSDVFQKAGVEYASTLTSIRFSVEKRPDGQPFLAMRSTQPINDPFIDMLLELSWASGRLVREYTFLLDPPEAMHKPVAQTAPVALPTMQSTEVKAAPTVSPSVEAVSTPAPQTPSTTAAPSDTAKPVAKSAEEKAPGQERSGADMRVVKTPDGEKRLVKVEPSAKDAETHTVKHGETLGKIASENRREGVNLDQMLTALFRNNKDAFDGDNINRLKTGKILSLPDRDTVAAIDEAEARQFVVAQSTDFNAYRRKLAAATLAAPMPKEEEPTQSATGKIAPKVEEKQPSAVKDKLEISRADSAAAKSAAGRRSAAEEEQLAHEKSLKEANARIVALDKSLSDLKKLAELKNQNMAELQKQAQATKAAVVPPAAPEIKKPETQAAQTPTPAPAVQPPSAPQPPVAPAATPEVPASPSATKPVEVAPPVEKPAAPATPTTPVKPEVKKPLPPPPPSSPSFIEENPEIIFGGGGGILALLLGYFGYSFWRKKRPAGTNYGAQGPSTQAEPSISSVFGSTGGHVVDTSSTASSMQSDFSVAEVGGNNSGEGVDPIKEADVYMAYGRNAQAEEILLDALKTEPERQAIHLKLLEIYAARKSTKQFESIATDLKKLTGGNGADWERIQQLGLEIDPDNSLYSSSAVEEAPYDPAATMVMSPKELGELAKSLPPESASETQQMQATMVQPAMEFPAAKLEEAFSDSIDLELDLGAPNPEHAADTHGEAGKAETAETGGLDFDVGPGESGVAPATASATKADASTSTVDFDFDLGGGSSALAADQTQKLDAPLAQAADGGNLIDFDIAAPAPASTNNGPASTAEPDFDISLEMPDETAAPSLAPSVQSVDLASINLDLDGGAAEASGADDAGSQDVETKLELAQAYEEMGDKDGARELLQEVLNEGNARQQAAARGKLDKLG